MVFLTIGTPSFFDISAIYKIALPDNSVCTAYQYTVRTQSFRLKEDPYHIIIFNIIRQVARAVRTSLLVDEKHMQPKMVLDDLIQGINDVYLVVGLLPNGAKYRDCFLKVLKR